MLKLVITLLSLAVVAGCSTTPNEAHAKCAACDASSSAPMPKVDTALNVTEVRTTPAAENHGVTTRGPHTAPQPAHEGHHHDAPTPTAAASMMPETAPMATTAPAAVYTCPMHPEVVSSEPGKCPKCGMTLVKKETK